MNNGRTLSWVTLRQATPARIGLGRSGAGLPTIAHLDFQLAHARARDAVHAAVDAEAIADKVRTCSLETIVLRSMAEDRPTYLRRPDLGRRLDAASREHLMARQATPVDVLFVIADGLSATAVHTHAAALLAATLNRLDPAWRIGPVAIIEGGRVAVGDEIGSILGAAIVAVLIGERPGLSAADSLGVYITWQPAQAPSMRHATAFRTFMPLDCLSRRLPSGWRCCCRRHGVIA